ncbi:MAG: Phenylalanine-tRNA ligase alpha subunit [Candidatus Gottesmanbacteria bacterium GW2011_GWA1_43_11]|uniref:alanine--tRNA ligase n=1 Tax=Candidatus Gottesmanbacteria bacterium GW2011_GWA1_43_11 TaxID=1618436 RepID=A0A0G1EMD1_9BACT|nr:MAG: Phenylalanine-tRNA ligase alpha subunit [Candidatus Gottesmanbacteria bacterium GW2011_GWA1_43_11]
MEMDLTRKGCNKFVTITRMAGNLLYLSDSYQKSVKTKILAVTQKGKQTFVMLEQTVFYPEGGGQPSDQGLIAGSNGKLKVTHCRLVSGNVVHEGMLKGTFTEHEEVTAQIDWTLRFDHMRWHSARHLLHEVVTQAIPGLVPVKGEHGTHAYIEYQGIINPKLKNRLETETNMLVAEDRQFATEFVTIDELKERVAWVPEKLRKNKPLRILTIAGFAPTPDGGTQVKSSGEVGPVRVTAIESAGELTRIYYAIDPLPEPVKKTTRSTENVNTQSMTLNSFRTLLIDIENELFEKISKRAVHELEALQVEYFGSHGQATELIKELRNLPDFERKAAGQLVNEFKSSIQEAFIRRRESQTPVNSQWFDVSLPGIKPPQGHLHIVSQAIMEITEIFSRIGFTRVRHKEVDWDEYAFEKLNMPAHHPARDEWETFFIEQPTTNDQRRTTKKIVLTPHTSNGQVREMEKGKLPIRMINIAKCYRRQSDVSHVPMFHQFEGLYIDYHVSIGNLKGVFDFFVQNFYGEKRKTRLRPYHFQFTEPSFEVDINCGICLGKGCKLCKSGWLELGGAGMVHPNVLKAGKINPDEYNGFAFGWGAERTYMMKSGTQLDDIRLLYNNDLRFLEQF